MHWLLLLAAAFAAGMLNAVAGGGSFLTFPALVFTGVPPIAANATSALAVSPGYLGSALGFREELARLPRRRLVAESALCALGGLAGGLLLLWTPARVFAGVVPWLLVFATAAFAFGPWLVRGLGAHAAHPLARNGGLLLVAVYGGYFNGGLGILLMALFAITGERDIHTANALKNLDSLVMSLVSVAAFALAGAIVWPQALAMMVAATAGGLAGARIARRLPAGVVRAIVIVTGIAMAGLFFARR
jgi:uncharacterized membrane protein YfcA